ncbi:MAG: amidohydrolase family protein [Myxococcota bacterium]
MPHDLLIQNATIVDGTGAPRREGDVAVSAGRITEISDAPGKLAGQAATETIDAGGQVLSPGFIDGHTHMDAQVYWDPLGTCSSYHGITSVVMGNCGFTLAPSREEARELVVRNLERAEDISPEAMSQGIEWGFETYPEYMDAVDKLPKGINYAGYVGHSALRTYVMGERAFEEAAKPVDLAEMARELQAGMDAGAMGFTTSRTLNHLTSDDRPVASRLAEWEEVCALVNVAGASGGIFEITNEDAAITEPKAQAEYFERMSSLALSSGATFMFGVGSTRHDPEAWMPWMDLCDRVSDAGGRMFAQVHSRRFDIMLNFEGQLPFDGLPAWKALRDLPLADQKGALRDASLRTRLVHEAHHGDYGSSVGAEARKPDYDWVFIMEDALGPHANLGQLARERALDPVELMIEMALESDFKQNFMQPIANEIPEQVFALMEHPRSVVTFSDAGAHVSQISDCSISTHLLGHWVRREQALPLEAAVQMITSQPADAFGFADRGRIREGNMADLVLFDPDTIAPEIPEIHHDLPGGARRLVQKAQGISATVVAGEVLLRDGVHTGALPGKLLRRGA